MPNECELCAELDSPGIPLCDECGQCSYYDCECASGDDFELGAACELGDTDCEACQ